MSDLFNFDTEATRPLEQAARANSVDSLSDLEAPAFHGAFRGLGEGLMRGGARATQALGTAAFGLAQGLNADPEYTLASGKTPAPIPEEIADDYFRGLDEHTTNAVDFWTPSPQEVGKVGQILGGLGEIVLPLAATGGDPALLIGTQELGRATELAPRVGTGAALGAGAIAGTAAAAGLRIPVVGSTLATRLVSGAAGNLGFGAAARGAEGLVLSEHPELAPKILDPAALTTDALTGLLFGGLHHTLAPRIDPRLKPSEVDAVLAGRNAKSFQQDTAPGAPEGTLSEVGHQSALEAALEQVSRGLPVDVSDVVGAHEGAHFADATHVAESEQLARAVEEGQPQDVPYEPDSVNSEPGESDTTYSVQEGELTDEQLQAFQGLRSELPPDQNVGGTGDGVSGESGHPDDGGAGQPLTVYRGASRELVPEHFGLDSLGKATGHPSSGLGVFFSQSREEAARYGTVAEHHLDIRNPKTVPVEDLPSFDSTADAHAYQQKLIAAGHDGMVIDASHLGGPVNYVAFKPEQVISKGAPRAAAPATTRAGAPSAKPEAATELPEVVQLQRLATERPDASIYSGYDAEGQPQRTTLADIADQIKREHLSDLESAKAYEAAVQCFLGRGA